MLYFLLVASAFFTLLANAITFPPPEPCTGNCTGHVHDPSVVRRNDGKYFRFTTNGRINIATAPSMTGPWTYRCPALPKCSKINIKGKCDLWAPDVIKVDGKYYMYYSVSSMGSKTSDIGVATSPNMECGTWTDHGSIGIPTGSWNRIDANLLSISPKSKGYMLWGSFWTGIWQARMASPPLRVVDNVKTVHLEQNTTKRPDNRPTGPSEGGFQFRWRIGNKDWYYLFFSSGGCCNVPPKLAPPGEEYKVMVCRSDRPEGPFVDKRGRNCASKNGGTLLYWGQGNTFAAGGQGVMYDGGLRKVVMYYHYIDKRVGYAYEKFKFGWNVLRFGNDGWPVVVPWDRKKVRRDDGSEGEAVDETIPWTADFE
ncbi:hypothetical protein KC333_g9087 [Hortaea werneckii]|nr:hypothetical protein KC333_g9087 [Hortaea werneckii]KAI7301942.1 hypothetical protein KC326_g9086 [Hortaea werneckii]